MMHRRILLSVGTGLFFIQNSFPYLIPSLCPQKTHNHRNSSHVEIFAGDVMQWVAMELELEDISWTDLSIDLLYDLSKLFQLCVSIFLFVIRR